MLRKAYDYRRCHPTRKATGPLERASAHSIGSTSKKVEKKMKKVLDRVLTRAYINRARDSGRPEQRAASVQLIFEN